MMRLRLDPRILLAVAVPAIAFVGQEKFLDAHEEMRAAWDSCIGEVRYPRKVCPEMLKNTKHGRFLKALLDTCKSVMSFDVLMWMTWSVIVLSVVGALVARKKRSGRKRHRLPQGIKIVDVPASDDSSTSGASSSSDASLYE